MPGTPRPLDPALAKHHATTEQRLRRFRPQGKGQSPGVFRQPPEKAFKKAGFPPKTPEANVRRGLAAADMVIKDVLRGGKGAVRNAMHRKDLGPIHLHWGDVGRGSQYRGGHGLSHILAKHGVEALEGAVEAIARGKKVTRIVGTKNALIEHSGHTVVLALARGRKGQEPVWVITGYRRGRDTDIPVDLSKITGPVFFRGK